MSDDRLRHLLGGPEVAGLRARLRARFERGDARDGFTLNDLIAPERQALEGLLGRAPKLARSMQLSHAELDHAIARAGLASDLRAALERLDGPIADRRGERVRLEQAWNSVLASLSDQRLSAALAESAGLALLKRCARGDPAHAMLLVEQASRVLALLPASGMPRAQLAAQSLGNAHALDAGQPIAALVLRACRVGSSHAPQELTAIDPVDDDSLDAERVLIDRDDADRDSRGLSVRDQWARMGVVVSELAAPALCLNLLVRGDSPCAEIVRTAARRGEPVHLTLRALLRNPPAWDVAGVVVSVCENASIVAAAADRLQTRCAPLVCGDGMPGAAQQVLLQQLAEAGAKLRYHGDFDWPGVRIGNFVMREFGAGPWRFRAEDYLAVPANSGPPLAREKRITATWDNRLADAMLAGGHALHEERVVDLLLADLPAEVGKISQHQ